MSLPPLLAYSHHRWESVEPRPRNVLSRLAGSRRVLFIEEPIGGAAADAWDRVARDRNLTICRPRLRGTVQGFALEVHERLAGLLEALVTVEGIGRHTAWLTTPLAYPPARTLAPDVIVYDCMENLAARRDAPCEVGELEERLLRHADLVLTGGSSLHRACRERHPNVHCVPNSLDVTHFRRGRTGQPTADEYADVPRPRLGYCGVLDERIDFELLSAVAAERPTWSISLVGPLDGVDAADLPRRPNLRYVGARLFAELPRHVAAWDLSLLPWRLDETTRAMGATAALEAMAAEHPIVVTPVRDVVEAYEDIVHVAEGAEAFIAACERALAATAAERATRTARMRSVLATTSWDHTARRIEEHVRHVEDRVSSYGRSLEQTLGTLLRARGEP